jgi:uncharacterized protein with NAD-binding domain and iron-sulfur cluster
VGRVVSAPSGGPIKVAVLGAGAGALSAALALTDPARGGRYQVTVYTMGWRFGGKGASGRNAEFGQRIEEHGIHVWFGFYDNAFRLLDGCYRELVQAGWQTPDGRPVCLDRCIGSKPNDGAAFSPHEHYVVNEQRGDDGPWSKWRLLVPSNDRVPGDGQPVPPETSLAFVKLAEMLEAITDIRAERAREGLESLPAPPPDAAPETGEELGFRRFAEGRAQVPHENTAALAPEDYLRNALDGLAAPALDEALVVNEGVGRVLDADARFRLRLRFVAWTLRRARDVLALWAGVSDRAHRLYLSCDTFAAIATGLARDVFGGKGTPEENMQALDAVELRAWLKGHGADERYLRSNPTVRFIYNSAFAFVDGKHQQPSIAAGAALRGVLRLFLTYKGAFAYRMAAGMGDVVFSPIHEVLRRRGVRFAFFHRVDGLGVADADGVPVVDEIRVTEQVPLAGAQYDPFVWVKDFPCWPSQPRWEQLARGAEVAAAARDGGLNLEDPGAHWPDEVPHTLRRGEDFDEVVLGIPVAALKAITGELCAHATLGASWRAMLDNSATTPTQGFQVWSRASLRDLGWTDPPAVFGTYVEPIDTYIDMTPALALEERRRDDIKTLSYFCGVFDRRPGETHAAAMQRAADNAVDHLVNRCGYIWPELGAGASFAGQLLWGGRRGQAPGEIFRTAQFARANVLPSELYTLNLPGTSRYRLRPDAAAHPEDGPAAANLWLAGDWTRNPINLGCVEATVMSGLMAARGLTRDAIEIVGERDTYLWQSIGRGERRLSTYESASPAAPASWTAGDEAGVARLETAVAAFDRPAVEEMCAALVQRLQAAGPPITVPIARRVLSALRSQRHFDLMRQVADVLLQAGVDAPPVRRQYAQALLDQNDLTAALVVLRDVTAESNTDLEDRAEGLGLVGRAYKQQYVNAPGAARAGDALRAAIESYHRGYVLLRANRGWHGVNTAALILRARRDGVGLGGALAAVRPEDLAQVALAEVRKKTQDELSGWDHATAAEANLVRGDHEEALACLRDYVARPRLADAFAIAGTLRQLREVWQLTLDADPGALAIPLLQGQLLQRQGGALDLPARQLQSAPSNLQKILGVETAVTLQWYRTGLERCRLVARVTDQFERGGGTGFLVRAGDLLPGCAFAGEMVLLTNAHVLEPAPRDPATLAPRDALVRFEAAAPAGDSPPIHRIREIVWTDAGLDATLARLDPAPRGIDPCPFAPADGPAQGGRVVAIGHPRGGHLSLSLNDNLLIDHDDRVLHYRAPTEPGSSGSPVFDAQWRLIALHHAGGLSMRRLNGKPGVYPANEGIWIEAIRRSCA